MPFFFCFSKYFYFEKCVVVIKSLETFSILYKKELYSLNIFFSRLRNEMKHWRSHIYVAVCMWKCIFSIGIDFYSIDYTLTLGRNCTPHTGHFIFYSYRPLCTTIIYLSNHLTFFSFPFIHFELCKNDVQHIFFSSSSWLLLYFFFDDYYTEFIDDYMMTECVYHVYRY